MKKFSIYALFMLFFLTCFHPCFSNDKEKEVEILCKKISEKVETIYPAEQNYQFGFDFSSECPNPSIDLFLVKDASESAEMRKIYNYLKEFVQKEKRFTNIVKLSVFDIEYGQDLLRMEPCRCGCGQSMTHERAVEGAQKRLLENEKPLMSTKIEANDFQPIIEILMELEKKLTPGFVVDRRE
ncbi:MAG: hypothetical protein HQK52_12495 [Oligoflexia bacterium]|nr:hypothetical protein [Oligoflexia bacterium]